MTDMVTALRLLISGDSAGAVAAIKEVGDATEETDAKTKAANDASGKQASALKSLTTTAMVAGGALAVLTGAVALSVKGYADYAEAVIKGAAMTGMSVESYSKLAGELKFFGVSTDSATNSMKFFSKAAFAAESGTKTDVKYFNDLGISMAQLKDMSPAQQLETVRSRLAGLSNAEERTYLTTLLFGRGSQQMILWTSASQKEISKIDSTCKQFGLTLTTSQAKALEQGAKDIKTLGAELQGLEYELAREVLPTILDFAKGLMFVLEHMGPIVKIIPLLMVGLTGYLAIVLPIIAAQKLWTMAETAWVTLQGLWQAAMVTKAVLTNGQIGLDTLLAMVRGKVTAAEALGILTTNESTVATEANTIAVGEGSIVVEARTAFLTEETIATEASTVANAENSASMMASLGPYALVAAAIAADIVLVQKAIQAYDQWQAAEKQAAAANTGFNQNAAQAQSNGTAAQFGQLKGGQTLAQIQASEKQDQYHSPGLNPLKWLGEGGEFDVSKPTVIGVGEKGTEHVTVVPNGAGSRGVNVKALGSGAAAGGGAQAIELHFHFDGAMVIGLPTRQAGLQLAQMMAQPLGEMMHSALHGSKR